MIRWNGRYQPISAAVIMRRWMSSQEITKNIKFVTEEPRKIEKDEKTLRFDFAKFFDHEIKFLMIF